MLINMTGLYILFIEVFIVFYSIIMYLTFLNLIIKYLRQNLNHRVHSYNEILNFFIDDIIKLFEIYNYLITKKLNYLMIQQHVINM